MSKTEKLIQWARGWPPLDGYLKLNAIVGESGDRSLNTVASDEVTAEYIDGTADRVLTFAFAYVEQWSDGFDDVNATASALGESWIKWVSAQNDAGTLPELPNAYEVEAVAGMPTLAMVQEDDSIAKYQFFVKVRYID